MMHDVHLSWSYICENSQHIKSHSPTLLRSGLKFFCMKQNTHTHTRTKPYIEAACCLKMMNFVDNSEPFYLKGFPYISIFFSSWTWSQLLLVISSFVIFLTTEQPVADDVKIWILRNIYNAKLIFWSFQWDIHFSFWSNRTS